MATSHLASTQDSLKWDTELSEASNELRNILTKILSIESKLTELMNTKTIPRIGKNDFRNDRILTEDLEEINSIMGSDQGNRRVLAATNDDLYEAIIGRYESVLFLLSKLP